LNDCAVGYKHVQLLLLLLAPDRYKDELGHAIVNFARVVPDGLLVFFPAYAVLQSCLDHWKSSSGAGEVQCRCVGGGAAAAAVAAVVR
jgi:Rad3-related DNA helicase